jgi:drug/metabolite transporter (DMT)-like permease
LHLGTSVEVLGEDAVSVRQIVGLGLVVIGIVALVWGGVFWTDRDTVLDAGPVEIETENREGVALPPVIGIVSLVAGAILLLVPKRSGA